MPSLIPEDTSVPGIHALVIGVSRYPHISDGEAPTPSGQAFDIGQLTSAARSASEFACWLLRHQRLPGLTLKSLRVLLSPSDGEQVNPTIAALLPAEHAATTDAVLEALGGFKAACDSHRENVAIVYVAGHGVQLSKHGATLLLEDFGRPGQLNLLDCSLDMTGVHAGMNHDNTAQTQFWFVDACRQRPEIARRFEALSGGLTLDQPRGTTHASLLYLATTTENLAYGVPGGVSLFYKALSWALEDAGAAEGADTAQSTWRITANGLNRALPAKVKEIAATYEAEQHVDITGKINEVEFHRYEATPQTDLRLVLRNSLAAAGATGTLLSNNGTQPVLTNCATWPIEQRVLAGLYLMKVNAGASHSESSSLFLAMPPRTEQLVPIETGGGDG